MSSMKEEERQVYPANPFVAGDVVGLNSGGPDMTVTKVTWIDSEEEPFFTVSLVWFPKEGPDDPGAMDVPSEALTLRPRRN